MRTLLVIIYVIITSITITLEYFQLIRTEKKKRLQYFFNLFLMCIMVIYFFINSIIESSIAIPKMIHYKHHDIYKYVLFQSIDDLFYGEHNNIYPLMIIILYIIMFFLYYKFYIFLKNKLALVR